MFQQQLSYEEVLENKIKSLHSKIERLETELKASKAKKKLIANTMALLVSTQQAR